MACRKCHKYQWGFASAPNRAAGRGRLGNAQFPTGGKCRCYFFLYGDDLSEERLLAELNETGWDRAYLQGKCFLHDIVK